MVGTLPMRVMVDGFTKAKSVRLIENQHDMKMAYERESRQALLGTFSS
jgi:hypothetical protein